MKKHSTRDLIANSTLDLLQTKRIDEFNVMDIVNNCGVSKRSFYNHFKDKYDVCNYIYDSVLDNYCWYVDGKLQSLSQFFERAYVVFNSEDKKIRNFLNHTICYQGQNCMQDYVATRGVSDIVNLLRNGGREDLITHENLFLMEFFMRGMMGMTISVSNGRARNDIYDNYVDWSKYLPKELYDALIKESEKNQNEE